jgi:hypothetical protein
MEKMDAVVADVDAMMVMITNMRTDIITNRLFEV